MNKIKREKVAAKYAAELVKMMKIRMVFEKDIKYIIESAILEYETVLLKEIKPT